MFYKAFVNKKKKNLPKTITTSMPCVTFGDILVEIPRVVVGALSRVFVVFMWIVNYAADPPHAPSCPSQHFYVRLEKVCAWFFNTWSQTLMASTEGNTAIVKWSQT